MTPIQRMVQNAIAARAAAADPGPEQDQTKSGANVVRSGVLAFWLRDQIKAWLANPTVLATTKADMWKDEIEDAKTRLSAAVADIWSGLWNYGIGEGLDIPGGMPAVVAYRDLAFAKLDAVLAPLVLQAGYGTLAPMAQAGTRPLTLTPQAFAAARRALAVAPVDGRPLADSEPYRGPDAPVKSSAWWWVLGGAGILAAATVVALVATKKKKKERR